MSDTKKVKMLANCVGKDGESLQAGRTVTLTTDSADRWVRRGKAEYVGAGAKNDDAARTEEDGKDDDDDGVEAMTVADLTAALDKAKVAIPANSKKADLVDLHRTNIKPKA